MATTEDDMDKPVTKRELHEVLATWGGALEARFDTKLDRLEARIDRVEAKVATVITEIGEMGRTLAAELRQHSNRVLEEARQMVRGVDDKYSDLPRRVDSLEHEHTDLTKRVEVLEANAPPPKRQRRR